ncbi:MAG: ParB/RepB/Spo0J family partition protein [Patescibacteria group bacterium]|jgi:ParB family chromosome partitioning protein
MLNSKNETQKTIKLELIDEPVSAMRTQIDPDAVRTLADSIRVDGLINPITVRPIAGRYQVVAGHRRLLACRQAPLYDVPCVVRDLTDEQVFNVMSAENLAREDVNPVDQAIHIARLIGEDASKIPDVAKRLHYSEQWVRDRLEILEYPDFMIPHIASGVLKLGVAQWLSQIKSEFWLAQYVNQAVTQGMSVTQARYLHDQSAMGLMPDPGDLPPPDNSPEAQERRLMRNECAACGQMAVEPNLQLVWIHRECPSKDVDASS